MSVQKSLAKVGIAKQSAKGTPAANPEYLFGVSGGNVGGATLEESDLPTTWDTRGLADVERTGVTSGLECDLVGMPLSLGRLLAAVCGSASYGSSLHTITPGATLAYHTLFGELGGTGLNQTVIQDAKIDELELSWDKSGAVKVKISAMGCTLTYTNAARAIGDGTATIVAATGVFTTALAHGLSVNDPVQVATVVTTTGITASTTYYVKTVPSSTTFTLSATAGGAALTLTGNGSVTGLQYMGSLWTAGSATSEQPSGGKFRGAGGIFVLTTGGGTQTRVTQGSIKIKNEVKAYFSSASTTPDEVFEGDVSCDVSLTIIPSDLSLYREIVTGSPTGVTPAGNPLYGSVQLRFVNGTDYVDFAALNLQVSSKVPDADPKGGAVELPVEGKALRQSNGGVPFTFTVKNSRVTSY